MSVKQVTRMEVDGSLVEIKPIEREESYSSAAYWINDAGERVPCDSDIHYRQRSLYEVYVDDVHRGWVEFPNGWGGEWTLYSLRPQHERFEPTHHKHDAEEKSRYGRQGYYRTITPGSLNETENFGEHRKRWTDRNDILAHVPALVKLGRLPDAAEMEKRLRQWKRQHAARVAEDAAREVRWAEEKAERARLAQIAAEEAEVLRRDTEEGLQSILDRAQSGELRLSNSETEALQTALARWRPKA